MEQTINLVGLETKNTKAGQPMWTANTNSGKMSVFDKIIADHLSSSVGKSIVIELEEKNGYKNITKFVKVADIQSANQFQTSNNPYVKDPRETRVSVCISYAKDLCSSGKIEVKDIETQAKSFLALYEDMLKMELV